MFVPTNLQTLLYHLFLVGHAKRGRDSCGFISPNCKNLGPSITQDSAACISNARGGTCDQIDQAIATEGHVVTLRFFFGGGGCGTECPTSDVA